MTASISSEFPFPPNFVSVLGSNIHYVEAGSGRPVLFLHGSPAWSYLWRNVIPHVAEVGRCIAPDLIGMGKSAKPDIDYSIADQARYLAAAIELLGLHDIIMVAHGWGAALALDYASRFPSRIAAMALLEPIRHYADWSEFPPLAVATFRKFRSPISGRALVMEQNVFIEQVLPRTVKRTLAEEEMRNYRMPFLKAQDRLPLFRFANEVPIGGDPPDVSAMMASADNWFRHSDVPKLLLYATPGANVTVDIVDWYRANLTNISISNVGSGLHLIPEDCPHEAGIALLHWIRSLR